MLRNIIFASQGSNSLPVGTILPYTGNLNKIPHGWFLCDGSNGTPDLRNRFLEGSNIPGKFIEAGLPNITGILGYCIRAHNLESTGAFRGNGENAAWSMEGQSYRYQSIRFDASYSNHIYNNSDTVQPPAYTVYYIIRIM